MNISNFVNRFQSHFAEVAAVLTWGLVLTISLQVILTRATSLQDWIPLVVLLFIVYLACFLSIIRHYWSRFHRAVTYSVISVQLLSAFALMLILPFDYLPILTIIWVAILPHVIGFKRSLLIMTLVVASFFALRWWRWGDDSVFVSGLLYYSFHLFALLMIFETIKSQQATLEAQRLNKELQATQHLLTQASKQNERTRIARDLHDLLGHHLTALIINLQVVSHLTEGSAKQKVDQCHHLAKLLLSDVREAVSALREGNQLEFPQMLDLMCAQVPRLTIEKNIAVKLDLEHLSVAKVLLSCIQEAITNSLRHSQADHFWIDIQHQDQQLILKLWDNGIAHRLPIAGHGLTGMRERVEAINGKLDISLQLNAVHLLVTIPLPSLES